MFCSNCGKELETGDLFCVHCGARQEPAAGNEGPAVEKVAQADPAGVVTPASGNTVAQEITTMSLFNGWKSLSGVSGLILGLYFILTSGPELLWGLIFLGVKDVVVSDSVFRVARLYGLYLILRPALPRHISLRAIETLLFILSVVLSGATLFVCVNRLRYGSLSINALIVSVLIPVFLSLSYFKNRKVGICCALLLIVASCVIALCVGE